VVMRQHKVWCVCVACHAHTPNVMLPHHHNWPFTFLNF